VRFYNPIYLPRSLFTSRDNAMFTMVTVTEDTRKQVSNDIWLK